MKRKELKRWHGHPPKQIKPTTEGRCPYCHVNVKSLEHHIHDKHKGEKLIKRK